jgi:hypothetical protein
MDAAAHPITIGKQTGFGSWESVACRVHWIVQSGDGVKVPQAGLCRPGLIPNSRIVLQDFSISGLVSTNPETFQLRVCKADPELSNLGFVKQTLKP